MIMKKFKAAFLFAAVFSVFLFTGCGEESNIENKLIGKWVMSIDNEEPPLLAVFNFQKNKEGSVSITEKNKKNDDDGVSGNFFWETKTFPVPEEYKDTDLLKNQKSYTEIYIKSDELGNMAYLYIPAKNSKFKADSLMIIDSDEGDDSLVIMKELSEEGLLLTLRSKDINNFQNQDRSNVTLIKQ